MAGGFMNLLSRFKPQTPQTPRMPANTGLLGRMAPAITTPQPINPGKSLGGVMSQTPAPGPAQPAGPRFNLGRLGRR